MPTYRLTTAIYDAEYLEASNPVLLEGERVLAKFYEEDGTVKLREKVGDGGTPWNDLPWYTGGSEKGDKGDTGPMPKHEWSGTSLRFQNHDATWGKFVNLKGEPGNKVNATVATSTTLGGVIPATGLRVSVEGYEYVALGWDPHLCYFDPVVVLHKGELYKWLQRSGPGLEEGVREPGTKDARGFWKDVVADVAEHLDKVEATVPLPALELPMPPGTAALGKSKKYAREDHAHPAQVIPAAGTMTPAPIGIASVGKSNNYAREDHAHAAGPSMFPSVVAGESIHTGSGSYGRNRIVLPEGGMWAYIWANNGGSGAGTAAGGSIIYDRGDNYGPETFGETYPAWYIAIKISG